MSKSSTRTVISRQTSNPQNSDTINQIPGTTQLIPIIDCFIEKQFEKQNTQASIDTLKLGIKTLTKNRQRKSNMSDRDSNSDASSVKSYVTDPEPVDSFTHYLFLKTDFSLSRLSRKLIMQLNTMSLNDDEEDEENDDDKFARSGRRNKYTIGFFKPNCNH